MLNGFTRFLHKIFRPVIKFLSGILQASKYRRSSALSPIIAILGIVMAGALVALMFSTDPIIKYFFLFLLLVAFGHFILSYDHFRRHSPDRLHSEEYLLERKRIEVMAKQGEPPRAITAEDVGEPIRMIGTGE